MWVNLLVALVVGFAVTMLANLATTIYLHRTLAHRSLTMRPGLAWFWRLVVWLTVGIKPRQWVAVHRKHHAFTDVEGDPHSPALLGWVRVQLTNVGALSQGRHRPRAGDSLREGPAAGQVGPLCCSTTRFLGVTHRHRLPVRGARPGLGAHRRRLPRRHLPRAERRGERGRPHFGRQPYDNTATNLQWLAFLTAGEGLHNNHHAAPTSAKLALRRPEIDPAWWFIATFRKLGWVTIRLDKVVLARSPASRSAA